MKCVASIAILSILASVQFGQPIQARIGLSSTEIDEFYSFESDFEGWSINGAGLDPGDPTADEWSITRSQDMATDGLTSVKLDLTNNNDEGAIWIEKPFFVEPNRLYEVNVSYSFASEDGPVGSFRIITGVLKRGLLVGSDLIPAFRESTDHQNPAQGYRWLDKHYKFAARSDETANFWILIGILGTFEIRRTYYVDSVRVQIAPKPEGTRFYSFENDMEGWTGNAADVATADWSISRSTELSDDGDMSLKLALNNTSGKGTVWVERSFAVEPGSKYRVSLDYAFSSRNFADFRVIAGVFRSPPLSADDLSSAYHDDSPTAPFWIHKSYQFTIKSKKSSAVYVVIGVKGTTQTRREYYLDSVCVSLEKK